MLGQADAQPLYDEFDGHVTCGAFGRVLLQLHGGGYCSLLQNSATIVRYWNAQNIRGCQLGIIMNALPE